MKRSPILLLAIILCSGARGAEPSWPFPPHGGEAGAEEGDFVIGPDYKDAPEMSEKAGAPKGAIHGFTMNSGDSKIYSGLTGAYTRRVSVYIPRQCVGGAPAPFIVVQDGGGYTKRISTALDNLIEEHRVPPMIAIMVDSGGGDGKGSERGLEYDTVSGKYADFIESEVLPRVAKEYNVSFTKDAEGRATMGCSSGGAAAFTMGWFHPELYRRILTYSGTYVNQQSPENPASPHGAWEYHEHLIAQSAPKPLRVWLEVGENDNGAKADEASYHNWVLANERMAAALKTKGYHYRFEFAKGASHCDGRVQNQTLPEALAWLWRGYKAK